jgi:hypothetical protein
VKEMEKNEKAFILYAPGRAKVSCAIILANSRKEADEKAKTFLLEGGYDYRIQEVPVVR